MSQFNRQMGRDPWERRAIASGEPLDRPPDLDYWATGVSLLDIDVSLAAALIEDGGYTAMCFADVAWAVPRLAQLWADRALGGRSRPADGVFLGRLVEIDRGWVYDPSRAVPPADLEAMRRLAALRSARAALLAMLERRIVLNSTSGMRAQEASADYVWFAAEMGLLERLTRWWLARRDRALLGHVAAVYRTLGEAGEGGGVRTLYWTPSEAAAHAVEASGFLELDTVAASLPSARRMCVSPDEHRVVSAVECLRDAR